jgi:uncharacterized protein DUF4136
MRGPIGAVALAACAIGIAGCATMNVSSHVRRDLDFAQYRTYDWGPADALPIGDRRLDQNGVFNDHVFGAFEKQLAARGYERVEIGETPDLLIHYHAVIGERMDVNQADYDRGYCTVDTCEAEGAVSVYEVGTLVLDVIDARTNRMVWRGWAQNSIDDALVNRDRLTRQINDGVSRMMASFPVRFPDEARARAGERR